MIAPIAMPRLTALSRLRSPWSAALACAVAGAALFHFAGNATHGYVATSSAWWWWISQWIDPAAETQHGWIILALSGWLLWRNLHAANAECRMRNDEVEANAECQIPNAEGQDKVDDEPTGSEGEQTGTHRGAGLCDPVARRMPVPVDAAVADKRAGDNALHPEPGPARSGKCHAIGNSAVGVWPSAFPALAALLAGLALHAIGFVAQQTRVSIVAVLVFTWGVLRLGGGARWGRAALFPLGFLAFAIPVNVLDSLGFWLRLWVVDAAEAIARVGGFGLGRSGTQLFAPDGHYQYDVAAACSGVRSLMALAALSLLIGYLRFRSPWRRGLMLLLCLPLTYLGNVARIGAIVLAAQAGGQRWGERAHDLMGFGVFAIVLGGVLLAARVLERLWPERSSAAPAAAAGTASATAAVREPLDAASALPGCHTIDDNRSSDVGGEGAARCHIMYDKLAAARAADGRALQGVLAWRGGGFVVAALVVVLGTAEAAWLTRVAASPGRGAAGVQLTADGRDPAALPAFLGTDWIGRRAEVSAVERAILPPDTGFSRRHYVSLQGGAHSVFFSVVLSGRDRTSIHRPELCLVGQGWTLSPAASGRLQVGNRMLPVTVLHTQQREPGAARSVHALVVYTFVSADAVVATHTQRFLRDAWNRLRHGRADRWAYVLAMADAEDGEAAALARIQSVFAGVAPALLVAR
jgi:EpsI family protein